MSLFNDLLTSTQEAIAALSLTWGSDSRVVPILVASQPLSREQLEQPLPIVVVSPAEPERIEQGATGGYMEVTYPVQITVVAPGNASFETNLPTYLSWRESIRKALQRVRFQAIPQMWFVNVKAQEVLNRDLQRDNYDFSVLLIEYQTLEQAK